MALFDKTSDIKAPPEIVWQEARRRIGRFQRLRIEIPYHFLVYTDMMGYVVLIEPRADGSTRLRHMIDRVAKIKQAIFNNPDPTAVLDALASSQSSPRKESFYTLLKELLTTLIPIAQAVGPEVFGELNISAIKKRAERLARKAGWIPGSAPVERAGLPSPPSIPVASPKVFPGLATFSSFAAAGILAGINWKRLGNPQWMWPTILLSVVGFLVLLIFLVSLPEELAVVFMVGSNLVVGTLLTYWQLQTYRQWVATYGEAAIEHRSTLDKLILVGVILGPIIPFAAIMYFS